VFYRKYSGKWINAVAQWAYARGQLVTTTGVECKQYLEVPATEVAEALNRCGQELPPELVADLAPRDLAPRPHQKRDTDDRDKWLYENVSDTRKSIKDVERDYKELAAQNGWDDLTWNGMKDAARRHAKRHNLVDIPNRRAL
jgi:hypothetical protein